MSTLFRPPDDGKWVQQAACREPGIDPEIFFPTQDNGPSLSLARSVCSACPVKQECFQDVMAAEGGKSLGSRHGVYAGLTPGQRHGLHNRARERAKQQSPVEVVPARKKREPAKCGTRGGYQKHLREKTEICAPCRQANTDADNRLRRTGTTRELAA